MVSTYLRSLSVELQQRIAVDLLVQLSQFVIKEAALHASFNSVNYLIKLFSIDSSEIGKPF